MRGVYNLIQEIINNFKNFIEEKDLKQGEAAELIQISRTHLNKILHGNANPSMALLMRMEEVMKNGTKN